MTTLGATLSTVEQPARVRVSTQFDKTTDATPANIPGLSITVTAGATYVVEANIWISASTAGGMQLNFGGTATATSIRSTGITYDQDSAAGTIRDMRQGTALGSTLAITTGLTNYYIRIVATIVVNAGGTLTVQFAQQSSVLTSSVLVNSSFSVMPLA